MLTISNMKILLLILFFGYNSANLQSSYIENSILAFDYSLTFPDIHQNTIDKLSYAKDGLIPDHENARISIIPITMYFKPEATSISCELWHFFTDSRLVILPNRSHGALGVKFIVKINPTDKSFS